MDGSIDFSKEFKNPVIWILLLFFVCSIILVLFTCVFKTDSIITNIFEIDYFSEAIC